MCIRDRTRSNSRKMRMTVLLNFVLFCLTCNRSIMHILPLSPCGLYSIRAQNGYGQHRPWKVVLLTLVTPRGVTELYISWGLNKKHARTAYHKTCGTEYQQPYRRCNSHTPYFNWNMCYVPFVIWCLWITSIYNMDVDTQFHKFHGGPFARVPYVYSSLKI